MMASVTLPDFKGACLSCNQQYKKLIGASLYFNSRHDFCLGEKAQFGNTRFHRNRRGMTQPIKIAVTSKVGLNYVVD